MRGIFFIVWKIVGGAEYASVKIASALFWVLSAVGITLIVRQYTKKVLVLGFVVLLWLIVNTFHPLINHNVYSSFVAIWAVVALLAALRHKKPWLYVIAGVVGALVFLFLQTKGLAVAVATVVAIMIYGSRSVRQTAWLIFVYCSAWVITVGVLTLQWDALTMLQSWFILPYQVQYLDFTIYEPWFIVIEIVTVTVMAFLAWRSKKQLFVVLVLMQAALYVSSTQLIDLNHFMINSFPAVIVLGYIIQQYVMQYIPWKKMRAAIPIALCIPLLFIGAQTGMQSFEDVNIYTHDIPDVVREGIFQSEEIMNAEHLYFGPFIPGMYFETRQENMFTQAANMTLCVDDCQLQTLAIFQEVEPEFALMNYHMVGKFGYNQDNLVDNYIQQEYELCEYHTGPLYIYARDECPEDPSKR